MEEKFDMELSIEPETLAKLVEAWGHAGGDPYVEEAIVRMIGQSVMNSVLAAVKDV